MNTLNQNFNLAFIGELTLHKPLEKKCRAIFCMIALVDEKEILRIPIEIKNIEGADYDAMVDVQNNCIYASQTQIIADDKFNAAFDIVSQFCKDAGFNYNKDNTEFSQN